MKTQKATTARKKETKSKNQPTNKDAHAAKAERKQTAPKGAKESNYARTGSKKEIVLKLLRRDQGATLEIAKATAWKNHSIRGVLSAQVTKKMKLKMESTKNDGGDRTYRIVHVAQAQTFHQEPPWIPGRLFSLASVSTSGNTGDGRFRF